MFAPKDWGLGKMGPGEYPGLVRPLEGMTILTVLGDKRISEYKKKYVICTLIAYQGI